MGHSVVMVKEALGPPRIALVGTPCEVEGIQARVRSVFGVEMPVRAILSS